MMQSKEILCTNNQKMLKM